MTKATESLDVGYGPQYPNEPVIRQQAYTCDNCSRLSVMTYTLRPRNVFDRNDDFTTTTEWVPAHGARREFPDVPEHIAAAATEATLCLSLEAFRAVGSLARAVIEATAKEKGITSGSLWTKIDAMYDAHLIREHIKEAAHEVRYFGNDMAHGDFVNPVTKEEAAEAVELMAEVLHEVFQSPARVARVREAREAKKA